MGYWRRGRRAKKKRLVWRGVRARREEGPFRPTSWPNEREASPEGKMSRAWNARKPQTEDQRGLGGAGTKRGTISGRGVVGWRGLSVKKKQWRVGNPTDQMRFSANEFGGGARRKATRSWLTRYLGNPKKDRFRCSASKKVLGKHGGRITVGAFEIFTRSTQTQQHCRSAGAASIEKVLLF